MANAKSKKRKKVIIFVLILLGLGGLGAAAMLKKREPVLTIQTEKVTRRNLTEVVVANGRIQPVKQVKISPEVSGEIIELPVKEGQVVKKGDLLLRIKPDFYLAARNSAEAGQKAALTGRTTAEANLLRARTEFKRIEELFKSALVSESAYVDAKTSADIAKANVESAVHQIEMQGASLKRAEEDLAKTTISAPLDGTVSRLNSQLGERVVGTAMMAGTEIMTIADLNEMEARVDVGEVDVVLIAVGQHARLEVDAYKDRKFNGAVTEIANSSRGLGGLGGGGGGQSQEATKFEVKIRVQEKELFRPGMSVTAEVETRSRTNALTVPIASVTTRLPKEAGGAKPGAKGAKSGKDKETRVASGGNAKPANPPATNTAATNAAAPSAAGTNAPAAQTTNSVAAAKKPGEAPKPIEVVFLKDGDLAKMLPVKRGISDDNYMEITDGLKEGQEVISGGFKAISRDLEDGKKVRVGTAKPEADKEKK